MKFDFSTNLFSRDDLMKAVELMGVQNPGFIAEKRMKNGSVWAKYWVWNAKIEKWVICSTFVSMSKILEAKYIRTVERSRKVEFSHFDGNYGYTTTGHTTNGITCSCPNYSSKFAMFVNGHKFCKHTLAFSKEVWGCQKLSDYVNIRSNLVSFDRNAG